jgi:benzoyl-CoA reductase/2-hydroxyglutaryl-CoA dehydratase subunit BcrC/BadD/HgdB
MQNGMIPTRKEVIKRHKQDGGLVAAVFPVHYPKALLRAFDILPVEVWGPPGVDLALSDEHIQSYICPIVRNGMSFLRAGGLDIVDLIVVPHACDSLQGLGSSLLDFVQPKALVMTFYISRNQGPAAISFLAQEFERLYDELVKLTGKKPSDEQLFKAIKKEQLAISVSGKFLEAKTWLPYSEKEFYYLIRSREFLPTDDFISLIKEAQKQKIESANKRVPLILSGIVPEPMDLLDTIEASGGTIVADDLVCLGRRLYDKTEDKNPFMQMAASILDSAADSTRGSSIPARINHLRGLAEKTKARGVIFYNVKFCEPEQFYLPSLKKALDEIGLRSIELETELEGRLPNQLATRIQAFLETLK